jgi:hypothetical protein
MHYNKLDALRILGKAYHYLMDQSGPSEATHTIADYFGRIRRSLRIEELVIPKVDAEGYNGRGPRFF